MKINNNMSFTNFNGYKNLISFSSEGSDNSSIAYMAMQLDNERNANDLEKWTDIQRNLLHKKETKDHLVLHSVNDGDKALFIIDDCLLDLDNINSREEETYMLRAFDLFASITRRIIGSDLHLEDKNLYKIMIDLTKNLKNTISNQYLSEKFATAGAMKVIKHHITAELINRNIVKEMTRHLKL